MLGKLNRFSWYEEEKKPTSDKKLMIIEYVIEDLQLDEESFAPELRKGPIVVYFKLMDLQPIEFTEEFMREMVIQKDCDFYRTGKSCILALSELPEFPPTLIDLEVKIVRIIKECACVHEFPIAMSKVDLNPVFRDITNEYKVVPCKVPIIKTQRDWYLLTTDEGGGTPAGTISIDIRLSCFDKLAVSQMTIGTQEAVLTIENKGLSRQYTCLDFPEDPMKLCSMADDPFHDGDISRFLLDGMMAIATAGVPDDIDNWIALAQHQGWKPRPKPVVTKAEGDTIVSTICPDDCAGFKPRYPRPRYSQIRKDTTIPPECTDVCPTYDDAFKPLPVCPKKRKRIEEFLKGRKPCHELCPDCYFEHDPPIMPAKIHVPVFTEHYGEDGEAGEDYWFPFPFDHFPFPFEKEEETSSDNPEECDESCPWYSPEAIAKRKRKSFKYFKDGLRYQKRKKCPQQCPDCFYDEDGNLIESSTSSSSKSSPRSSSKSSARSSSTVVSSGGSRKSGTDTSSISSSSSGSSSTSSSSDDKKKQKKGKKSQPQEDCKCTMPDENPTYVSLSSMCRNQRSESAANQQRPKQKKKDKDNEGPFLFTPQPSAKKGRGSQRPSENDNKRVSFRDKNRGDSQQQDNNRRSSSRGSQGDGNQNQQQGNRSDSNNQQQGKQGNKQQQGNNRRDSQQGNKQQQGNNRGDSQQGNKQQGNNRGDSQQGSRQNSGKQNKDNQYNENDNKENQQGNRNNNPRRSSVKKNTQ